MKKKLSVPQLKQEIRQLKKEFELIKDVTKKMHDVNKVLDQFRSIGAAKEIIAKKFGEEEWSYISSQGVSYQPYEFEDMMIRRIKITKTITTLKDRIENQKWTLQKQNRKAWVKDWLIYVSGVNEELSKHKFRKNSEGIWYRSYSQKNRKLTEKIIRRLI